jgi:syntaxin 8
MSNPNALLLLADHIKLSLLEQQRAKTLKLSRDSQDGHISRSLDQFREGIEALEKEQQRLEELGQESYVSLPPSPRNHQNHISNTTTPPAAKPPPSATPSSPSANNTPT